LNKNGVVGEFEVKLLLLNLNLSWNWITKWWKLKS